LIIIYNFSASSQQSDISEGEESIFVGPEYRTQYWHSIEKVEFNDNYGTYMAGTFTPDDLLEIADRKYRIKKLRSIAQFHAHPNAQKKKVTIKIF
jgi:hypothetical protein